MGRTVFTFWDVARIQLPKGATEAEIARETAGFETRSWTCEGDVCGPSLCEAQSTEAGDRPALRTLWFSRRRP